MNSQKISSASIKFRPEIDLKTKNSSGSEYVRISITDDGFNTYYRVADMDNEALFYSTVPNDALAINIAALISISTLNLSPYRLV